VTPGAGGWRPLDLGWFLLTPAWRPIAPPVVISLDAAPLYGFAAISTPLQRSGTWLLRLRLGETRGAMRLVTADPRGERRQPRSALFPTGEAGTVTVRLTVPDDFPDMCLVIQKRDEGPGSVAIAGVDIGPDDDAFVDPVVSA
jgi:hypothetical protein